MVWLNMAGINGVLMGISIIQKLPLGEGEKLTENGWHFNIGRYYQRTGCAKQWKSDRYGFITEYWTECRMILSICAFWEYKHWLDFIGEHYLTFKWLQQHSACQPELKILKDFKIFGLQSSRGHRNNNDTKFFNIILGISVTRLIWFDHLFLTF